MSDPSVRLETTAKTAYVTLNRPGKRNAFNGEMVDRLAAILSELREAGDVVALVLRAEGDHFSAGADLASMKAAAEASRAENRSDARRLADMLDALDRFPAVTVARVQGAAMGGGAGLTACCDVVLAEAEAFFSFSEVRLGLIPATISPFVLRAIGTRQARRYMLTGERFSASRAREIGLVHEVAEDPDALDQRLEELLDAVRKNSPRAIRRAKRLCREVAGRTVDEDLLAEVADRIAEARSSEHGREGVDAFLNDRDPDWVRGDDDD